ncbi:FadR/GntR family transcriptional regulator [Lichenibacterium ramalinae]|uniref:FadR family transcriptional regulator n=1 Tax=Lichenibacterium ramalinae TaxID=2316527 RepID=A0A4Q2RHX7_9HYPH|nr:FadR/GntR family transcriptional regulator [Lichenibacterium ramalinae]RYB06719.1 FadR family transcriptional regulator [Lichenibacterium ramalinae]
MGEGRRQDPRRIYQQVADEIRALIRGGRFAMGARLPAERDLALQLGVSRPSLREALVALEIEGTVEIRLGAGVYVTAGPDRAPGATLAMGESPSELMHGRMTIEGPVTVLACARMTPATLAALRGTLERMRAAVASGDDPAADDRLFHVTIARQSGNGLLARIVGDLFDGRHSRLSTRISTRFENRDTWAAALSEHEAILAALDANDPLLAEVAMRRHLQRSADRWLSGLQAP